MTSPRAVLAWLALSGAGSAVLSGPACRGGAGQAALDDAANVAANVRAAAGSEPEATDRPPAPPGRRPSPPDTIEALLSAIAAGTAGDRLAARLEAVLERSDEAVPPALALVRGNGPSKLVIDALASAGTPTAQAGLCQLALDPALAAPVRREVVASLALVQRPASPTLRAVEQLLADADPELRHAALFTAAALARAGRRETPGAAARIERAVLAEYPRVPGNPDGDDRLDALAALGNLGSPAILPRLRAALGSPEPAVRAAAARALRFVPDPEADRLLLGTLRRDREPTVRAAALFAAGFRPIDPLADGLSETAETDPVEFVRANAVALLARHLDSSPRAARALGFVARNDPAPGVRQLAREAQPNRGPAPDASSSR